MDISNYSKEEIEELYKKISEFDCDVKIKYREIDWGNPKGQGKRIGSSMVIGNCDVPRGIKKYSYVDLSEYLTDETKENFKLLDGNRAYKYVVARKYGLKHRDAMIFAIKNI